MPARHRVLVAALCVATGGCLVPNPNALDETSTSGDTDDDTETSDSDDTAETETEGEPTCSAATHQCVDAVPEEWSGPVAFARAADLDALPACADEYAEVVWEELFDGFVPGDHECECACGDADPVPTCIAPVLKKHGAAANCVSMSFDEQLVADTCVELDPGPGWDGRFRFSDPGIDPAAACPPVDMHVIDEPSFEETLVVCGGAVAEDGCEGDQRCVPNPPEGFVSRACIWQEGEVECPPDSDYLSQLVVYQGSQTDRSCGECTCGAPDATCTGNVDIISGDCDPGVLLANIAADECSDDLNAAKNGRWNPSVEGTGACTPSESQKDGDATPVGAITLCCG